MIRVFEYKLKPSKTQEIALNKQLYLTNILYNDALKELIDYYEANKKHLNLFKHDKLHGSTQHPDIPAVLVDTTLKRLHNSFANFFTGIKAGRKVGFPRFKKLNRWHSLDFRDFNSKGVEGNKFKAGKKVGGNIKFIKHRSFEGRPQKCRLIKRPSGWYLQVVCKDVPKRDLPKTGNEVGIDFGIKSLVADSNGKVIPNPKFLERSLKRLKWNQRKLSRQKRGSNRYNKQAKRTARLHEKITNQRKDFFRKLSLGLIRNYDIIYIEDLDLVKLMRKQFNGRYLADSAIGILRHYLLTLAESASKEVVLVPAYFTSQKCSSCGELTEKSLSVRTHICKCGFIEDRDVNAALNILRLGQSLRGATAKKREAQAL